MTGEAFKMMATYPAYDCFDNGPSNTSDSISMKVGSQQTSTRSKAVVVIVLLALLLRIHLYCKADVFAFVSLGTFAS